MRIIDACDSAIETVAVSPDGRYVGASSKDAFGVFHWATGEAVLHTRSRRVAAHGGRTCDQIAFAKDSRWVIRGGSEPLVDMLTSSAPLAPTFRGRFLGGLAVSPDGRALVASEGSSGSSTHAALARWALPGFQSLSGFEHWSPLDRLALVPTGSFSRASGRGTLVAGQRFLNCDSLSLADWTAAISPSAGRSLPAGSSVSHATAAPARLAGKTNFMSSTSPPAPVAISVGWKPSSAMRHLRGPVSTSPRWAMVGC